MAPKSEKWHRITDENAQAAEITFSVLSHLASDASDWRKPSCIRLVYAGRQTGAKR